MMADRTVKTILSAQVTGYLAGMDQAARKTRETGSEIDRLAQKQQAFQGLGRAALAFGLAVASAIGLAVVKYAEFDAAMSNANAILQESTANQNLLKDAALDAGGATVFTAKESANAIEELGKAGIGTADILSGALRGSLDLAAAGQLGVARAAEITGITLKQFGLDGTQAGRVADVLSAGANRAVGSVDDLAAGLKFVGPVAASMNISLEDTTATLALFADRGVIGEQAGTSLRGMLSSLTSPSRQAKDELARLNVQLYDGQGQFKGLENVAGELNRSLTGVSDAERDMALGVIFGNQQVTAARILVDAGAETWRDYRDSVDDTGNAARIAAARMDNLSGDVEKLGGAFDTALIQTGSGANDVLRAMVQAATFLVDLVGGLPDPVLNAGLAIGVAAAAVGVLSGATFLALPRIVELRAWMSNAGVSAGGLAVKLGAATAALTIVTLAISVLVGAAAESSAQTDALAESFDQATGAVTEYTRELVAKRLAETGAFDAAAKAGISQRELTDAVIDGGAAMEDVTGKILANVNLLPVWNDRTKSFTTEQQKLIESVGITADELGNARTKFEDVSAATEDSTDATDDNARALAELEGVAVTAGQEIDDLADQIRNFGSAQFDVREANRQVEQSLADLRTSLEENGQTFDITTQAGRDNQAALDDVAASYLEAAAAAGIQAGSVEAALPVLEDGRRAFVESAVAAGIEEAAANRLADQLGLIPENVKTLIEANTSQAQQDVENFIGRNTGRTINVGVRAYRAVESGGIFSGGVEAFAGGGFPSGIYPGGRPIYKFAEEGVPWETFISGHPAYRDRNVGIWQETGERLGVWQSAPPMRSAQASSATAAPRFNLIVESKGGIDLLQYIDVRIESNDQAMASQVEGGRL